MPQLDKFKGVLPYATELRGVYQPILGWEARFARARVNRETMARTAALIPSLALDPRYQLAPDYRPGTSRPLLHL